MTTSDVTGWKGIHSRMEFRSIYSDQDDSPCLHHIHGTLKSKSKKKIKNSKKTEEKNFKVKIEKKN